MAKKHTEAIQKQKKKESPGVKSWFIIILIIAAVVSSTLMFVDFGGDGRDYSTYNHFAFEKAGEKWKTQVTRDDQLFEVPSNYHPYDLENISYNQNVTTYMMAEPHAGFILAVDDNGSKPVVAAVNIARILGEKFYGFPVKSAIYGEASGNSSTTNSSITYKTCEDATKLVPVIHISTDEDEPVVDFADNYTNCIVVGGSTGDEAIKAADKVVFKILRIMD
ncbi:MAG: hypothetical protein ACLFTH_00230 [Candidatus Woesearchaeota archaeon]